MNHNKYICSDPVSVELDGNVFTFTLNDRRHTNKETIRSILTEFALEYLCDNDIIPDCCNNLPLVLTGYTATYEFEELSLPLTIDDIPLTLGGRTLVITA
jgi:hypothetical protein